MVKRMRRFVSGQTEIARICGDGQLVNGQPVEHSAAMTTTLWNEWKTSRRLHQLFADRAEDPAMVVNDTAEMICGTKKISDAPAV